MIFRVQSICKGYGKGKKEEEQEEKGKIAVKLMRNYFMFRACQVWARDML